jgi:hypothetical protein
MNTAHIGREEFDALLVPKTDVVRVAKADLKEAYDRIEIPVIRDLIKQLEIIDLELANTSMDDLSKYSQLVGQAARIVEPFHTYAKQAA